MNLSTSPGPDAAQDADVLGLFDVLGALPIKHITPHSVDWPSISLESDAERARALLSVARKMGLPIHHNPARGWYIFDGRRWHGDDKAASAVLALSVSIGDAILEAAEQHRAQHTSGPRAQAANNEARTMEKRARQFHSHNGVKNIVAVLQNLPGVFVEADEFDSDPDVLGVANGVLDLRTGKLRDYAPDVKLTKHLNAEFGVDDVPHRWLQFLEEVLPDPDVREWLHRALGYAITGHLTEQFMLCLNGKGANGKSVLTDVLQHVLEAVTVVPLQNLLAETFTSSGSASPEVAMLQGKRIAIVSETDSKMVLNASLVKRMTGDATLTARWLNANPFTFKPTALPILSTNHLPRIHDDSHGMWRRIVVVPFDRKFVGAERDLGLADFIMANETDGILDWLAAGAMKWYATGLGEMPAAMADVIKNYRQASDRLGEFMDRNTEAAPGSILKAVDLYSRFKNWCYDEGHERVMSRTEFDTQMRDRLRFGIHAKVKVYHDVELVPEANVNKHLSPVVAVRTGATA